MGDFGFSPVPRTRRAVMVAIASLVLAATSAPVDAQSLNSMRTSGMVGEAFDGYARARKPAAQGEVERINAQRRGVYQKRARAQGVGIDQVGRVYAKQIMQNAPRGTWFLGESGRWSQK